MTEQTAIQNLVQVEATPAHLDVNFEQLRGAVRERLEQFETVVSADGVKDAKASATQLNKLKQELARRRKEAADEAKKPIQEFESSMKDIEGEVESARQQLLEQVRAYEAEVEEQARQAIEAERQRLWDEAGVEEYNRRATMDDLVKQSALTANGKLTKATREALEARAKADKDRQDMVEKRLLELENRSYRAGLAAPLTRDHVEQWLEADDETYEANLQRILDAEVERERQATERRRKEWEREQEQQRQRQEEERARQERVSQTEKEADQRDFPPEPDIAPGESSEAPGESTTAEPVTPEPDDNGQVTWTITATFTTSVAAGVSKEALEAETRRVLEEDAGVTTLVTVTAVPTKREAE